MRAETLMLGECVPLGRAFTDAIESSAHLVVPYWPADPQLGAVRWPASVDVLMPGRWAPPIGTSATYARATYLEQARALPGTVTTLAVAAVRGPDGWCLPWTAGTTGAVGEHGVSRLLVVDVGDRVVIPGAPLLRAEEVEVIGPAPSGTEGASRPLVGGGVVERMGAAVAALVPPGTWLEVGIGAIPSAVLRHLRPSQVSGFVCGLVGDEILRTVEAWRKEGWRRPVLAAMVQASDDLVRRAVSRGQLRLVPTEDSHGPDLDLPLTAVNGALTVDLAGNVNTETVAGRRVSGRGGHPDFSRRAHLCDGGLSVVVLRARGRDGASRIVPSLAAEDRSTTGEHVDAIVTEHGVADLRGLDDGARREAILAVAHPEDRRRLAEAPPPSQCRELLADGR